MAWGNGSICEECYRSRYPDREPLQVAETTRETCIDCGKVTRSGIFIRVDLAKVKYPPLNQP